jgi:hypothetical protein
MSRMPTRKYKKLMPMSHTELKAGHLQTKASNEACGHSVAFMESKHVRMHPVMLREMQRELEVAGHSKRHDLRLLPEEK